MSSLSIYQYSYAYELEQSSYVMNLAYRTLCLIAHTTYMIRLRIKLRWRFVMPSGLLESYAYRSVGLKSWGDLDSIPIHGHGARVYGDLRI
jgi:hypothetical protein